MPDERNSPLPADQSGLAPKAKKNEADEFPFSVSVAEVYDGPLDLLLDLIRKQDIDIYDIPIAKITAQYLVYVERIKQLDVDVAAEPRQHGHQAVAEAHLGGGDQRLRAGGLHL